MESFIGLGRIHIPLYGVFAAVGLMCAMTLGLRTAVLAAIDPDAFWDLGTTTILSAFIFSRVLLVAENLSTFRQFPLAVLELPFLSAGGVLLTLIAALWYMRRRRLPFLGVLDAVAPCAALLAVFLYLGRLASGTREGMPTDLPWAISSSFGRVHPVEIYAALAWAIACIVLFWLLRRQRSRGETAAAGLIAAGVALVLVDFFRLPNVLYGTQWLDGIQWRGLEMIVLGGVLLAWRLTAARRLSSNVPGIMHRDSDRGDLPNAL